MAALFANDFNLMQSLSNQKLLKIFSNTSQKLGFYNELPSRLQRLDVSSSVTACTNVHCKNEEHKQEIDRMMLDALHSLEFAADNHIPKPKSVNPNKPAKILFQIGMRKSHIIEKMHISGTQSGHQLENHSITTCI